MYDLRTLRDNLDAIREQLGPRGADVPWDRLRTLIEQRRTLTSQVEQLRHELKKGSEEVATLKREKQPADAAMAAMKAVGERIKKIEDELRACRRNPDRSESPHPESSTCLGAGRKRRRQQSWRPDGGEPRPP